jgi:CheY-like chemotaxis protein
MQSVVVLETKPNNQSDMTKQTRILLADDFVELAEMMKCALADAGYAVTVVHDGNQAVERLKADAADLVVLDIDMPGANGFEVCRFVKSREELRDLPVILCTGRYGPEDRARAHEVGAEAFVQKPFALAEFLQQVRAALAEGPDDAATPFPPARPMGRP